MKVHNTVFFLLILGLSYADSCLARTSKILLDKSLPPILPLVVIGSGPAGHTAAQYGIHLGVPTVLFTGPLPGGLLMQTDAIENYPGIPLTSGMALMDSMAEQTRKQGVIIRDETVSQVDLTQWPFLVTLEMGEHYRTFSLIIATGATPKKLNVPGEDHYWGRGVSCCALCDAHFFKDKNVVVVGGGNSAIDEALILAPHAKSVTIFVRGDRMRAMPAMQKKLQGSPTVQPIEYNKQVTKIMGTDDEITHLEITNLITKQRVLRPADGLFLAIGHTPRTDLFEGQLRCSDSGHIIIDEKTQATSIAGVFAAGDVEDALYRQAIVAAGAGCKAAINAVEWMREQGITDQFIKQHICTEDGSLKK